MAELAAIMQREIESHSDLPEAVVAYRVIGTTAWIGGDYVNARKYLERAVAVLPRESDGALAMRFGQDPAVSALFYFALVLFGLGEIDHARALGEEAFDAKQKRTYADHRLWTIFENNLRGYGSGAGRAPRLSRVPPLRSAVNTECLFGSL